jgi:hypothetical protein
MSIKGQTKEGAGFIEEETGEMLKNDKMAQKGRDLRNEGRIEDGKTPKTTKPGTGNYTSSENDDTDTK